MKLPNMSLEPFAIEEYPSFHCAVCGDGIYPGERYIELCGMRICDDCKCFEQALMQAAETRDFKAYAEDPDNGFGRWIADDAMDAISHGRPVSVEYRGAPVFGESIYRVFARTDWPHFADWYHDHMDSGEEKIA